MTKEDFEERQERRKGRLQDRAEKAKKAAEDAANHAGRIAGFIPFGQPILVGHHSERRHRRDLKRIDDGMRRAALKREEAEDLERRAHAVGSVGISSDDPKALEKLEEKQQLLLRRQQAMKARNAAWRKAGSPEPSNEPGWAKVAQLLAVPAAELEATRQAVLQRWKFQPGAPHLGYELTGVSSELRRIELRMEELERSQAAVSQDVDHGVCRLVENVDQNRIQLVFADKPDEAVRALLKRYGFRWSPSTGAWQRHLNNAGRFAARCVVEHLKGETA